MKRPAPRAPKIGRQSLRALRGAAQLRTIVAPARATASKRRPGVVRRQGPSA